MEMAKVIASNWKQALRKEGSSGDDIRNFAEALEHAEAEKALSLEG